MLVLMALQWYVLEKFHVEKSVQDICLQLLTWNAKEEMLSLLNDGGSGSNNSNNHPYDSGGNENCC